MIKINLNSPKGNVFALTQEIAQLLVKANRNPEPWLKEIFTYKSYDEIVEQCKKEAIEISKVIGEEIEIYSSEQYELI